MYTNISNRINHDKMIEHGIFFKIQNSLNDGYTYG
jgi:hypothetical protein